MPRLFVLNLIIHDTKHLICGYILIGGKSMVIILWVLLYLILIGLSVYSFVLFVKLAHRGIKALDIYINQNSNKLY